MTFESEEFHPEAARRLFLAVVNQAISDVLENKKEAKAAEQWLLSEEFDNFADCSTGMRKDFINNLPPREFRS